MKPIEAKIAFSNNGMIAEPITFTDVPFDDIGQPCLITQKPKLSKKELGDFNMWYLGKDDRYRQAAEIVIRKLAAALGIELENLELLK